MTAATQGSTIERINLTMTDKPVITHLPHGKFIATINGRDPDGEDRVARFNAPTGSNPDDIQKALDAAFDKKAIELEGVWLTRRYKTGEGNRNTVEFSVTRLNPSSEKAVESAVAKDVAPAVQKGAKSIALLATKDEVEEALRQLQTGKVEQSTPTTMALVLYREALEQPLYEPAGNGRYKPTGQHAMREDALESLVKDFGKYAQRNVYINEAKAADIASGVIEHQEGHKAILQAAVEETQARRIQAREAPERQAAAKQADPVAEQGAKTAPKEAPAAPAADPSKKASSIAHQVDPILLTASLGEVKAALSGKTGLNSPVAQMLGTFTEAVKQPQWRKKADGKGNEKTGVIFDGKDGLKELVREFGSQTFRNVYLDKDRATDVLMRMDDAQKTNDLMASALEKSKERRLAMNAERAKPKTKVKSRERDRD